MRIPVPIPGLLPSVDACRAAHLAKLYLDEYRGVVLVGTASSAKSLTAQAVAAARGTKNVVVVHCQGSDGIVPKILCACGVGKDDTYCAIVEDLQHLKDAEQVEALRELIKTGTGRIDGQATPAPSSLRFILTASPDALLHHSQLAGCMPIVVLSDEVSSEDCCHMTVELVCAQQIGLFFKELFKSALKPLINASLVERIHRELSAVERLRQADVPYLITRTVAPLLNTPDQLEELNNVVRNASPSAQSGHSAPIYFVPASKPGKVVSKNYDEAKELILKAGLSEKLLFPRYVAAVLDLAAALSRPQRGHAIIVAPRGSYVDAAIATATKLLTKDLTTISPAQTTFEACLSSFAASSGLETVAAIKLGGAMDIEQWERVSALVRDPSLRRTHFAVVVKRITDVPLAHRMHLLGAVSIISFYTLSQESLDNIAQSFNPESGPHISRIHAAAFGSSDNVSLVDYEKMLKQSVKKEERLQLCSERVSTSFSNLQFCYRLLQDLQGKPVMSQLEYQYHPDTEQGLRAFEGKIVYNDYPECAVRMLMKIGKSNEGKMNDIGFCATFYGTPQEEVFHPPNSSGGQTRGRIDSNDGIIIQTATHEFRMTLSSSGTEAALSGTVFDLSGGSSTAVGSCRLLEVIELFAISRQWLRHGTPTPTVTDEQLLAPMPPFTPEEMKCPPEDVDKYVSQAIATLKKCVVCSEDDLRRAFHAKKRLPELVLSSTLTMRLAPLGSVAREEAVQKAQEWATATLNMRLPHPLSLQVFAYLLNTKEEELAEWLFSQKETRGLPLGANAEANALMLQTFLEEPLDVSHNLILVSDPAGMMLPWLKQHERFSACVSADQEIPQLAADATALMIYGVTESNYAKVVHELRDVTCKIVLVSSVLCGAIQRTFSILNAEVTEHTLKSKLLQMYALPDSTSPQYSQLRDGVKKATTVVCTLESAQNDFRAFVAKLVSADSKATATMQLGDKEAAQIVTSVANACQQLELIAKSANAKGSKDQAQILPVMDRLSLLAASAMQCLPHISDVYRFPFSTFDRILFEVLRSPSLKGTGMVESASKEFCEGLLPLLLEEDRLTLAVILSFVIAGPEKRQAFFAFLSALRITDIEEHKGFEKRQQKAAADAFQEHMAQKAEKQRAKPDKKREKEKEKEVTEKSFLSRETKPDYGFMGYHSWVNILALAKCFPAWSGLPPAFHEGEAPAAKGALTHEQRWSEWLANPTAPVPFFEKDAAVGPVERLALVAAVRPEKVVAALLQFVTDTFGIDFADPFAADDIAAFVSDAQKRAPCNEPLVLVFPHINNESDVDQILAGCMKAGYLQRLKEKETKDEAVQAKSKKEKVVAPIKSNLLSRNASQPLSTLLAAIELAQAGEHWLVVHDAQELQPPQLQEITQLVRSTKAASFTRVILSFVVREHHFSQGLVTLMQGPSWFVCVNQPYGIRSSMLRYYSTMSEKASSFSRPRSSNFVHSQLRRSDCGTEVPLPARRILQCRRTSPM